jgi:hypothetical protein
MIELPIGIGFENHSRTFTKSVMLFLVRGRSGNLLLMGQNHFRHGIQKKRLLMAESG